MLPTLDVERHDVIFIPVGAEKGDCPQCSEGVLRREACVEKKYGVREGYQCDTCGRNFVEGLGLRFYRKYNDYNRWPSIPGRYFVEVNESVLEANY